MDIEELLKNNIYHIDLCNSPFIKNSTYNNKKRTYNIESGHSHVLVNPITLSTHLIDLDGKSTVYTEKSSLSFTRKSLDSLANLITEFLFNIENVDEYELDELINILEKNGATSYIIDVLIHKNYDNINDFKRALNK